MRAAEFDHINGRGTHARGNHGISGERRAIPAVLVKLILLLHRRRRRRRCLHHRNGCSIGMFNGGARTGLGWRSSCSSNGRRHERSPSRAAAPPSPLPPCSRGPDLKRRAWTPGVLLSVLYPSTPYSLHGSQWHIPRFLPFAAWAARMLGTRTPLIRAQGFPNAPKSTQLILHRSHPPFLQETPNPHAYVGNRRPPDGLGDAVWLLCYGYDCPLFRYCVPCLGTRFVCSANWKMPLADLLFWRFGVWNVFVTLVWHLWWRHEPFELLSLCRDKYSWFVVSVLPTWETMWGFCLNCQSYRIGCRAHTPAATFHNSADWLDS